MRSEKLKETNYVYLTGTLDFPLGKIIFLKELIMGKDNFVIKNVDAFLSDKPIWVWWVFHVVVTGALFGIFSLVLYLLGIQWWAGIFILIATGMIWGSIKYFQKKGKIKAEKKEAEQPV
jgi:hypothetical protein